MFRVIPELAVYLIFIHPFPLSPLIHLVCPLKFCITRSRLHFLLLGITVVPREIKDNVWAKSCGQDVERRIMGDMQIQPCPQGFSLKKRVGREKALASAGHVSPRTP